MDTSVQIWHRRELVGRHDINTVMQFISAFNQLLDRYAEFYPINRVGPRGGRPPKLVYHHQVLGLLMHYYEGSVGLKTLCEVFAVPPSTLQRTLAREEKALQAFLKVFILPE
ncbi:hypothetical protein PI124_g20545 [Phytophthora idaei]|nr:hypothetical protein PI124_g20545 [Phytophthora idaei]